MIQGDEQASRMLPFLQFDALAPCIGSPPLWTDDLEIAIDANQAFKKQYTWIFLFIVTHIETVLRCLRVEVGSADSGQVWR